MATIKSLNDSLVVTLDVEEFIRGDVQPRAIATMGGSVIAYFVMDKLDGTKYGETAHKFNAVITTFDKDKLVVTFKNLDICAPNGVQ
jgi:hypothetical protein